MSRHRTSRAGEIGLAPIRLDPDAATPLYRQIYEALRSDILGGHLLPGQRLAATRVMARELDVSRNTVVLALDQLLAEGYLTSRRGAGTFVTGELPEELLETPPAVPPTPPTGAPARLSERGRALVGLGVLGTDGAPAGRPRPFQPGLPALDAFPHELWGRLLARHLRHVSAEDFAYGDPAGHRPLREALATYLRAARGLACEVERILVVSGSQQGLDLAARVLLDPGDRVWVEDPGYLGARAALTAAGAELVPVPVDADGLRVDEGRRRAGDARLVCVTPSHQYPLGAVLDLSRRLALLEWADEAGAWIVEDDYDSEYRYGGRPLTALKGLDAGERVIYLGTFSKVMFPALRLGYLVVPPALVDAFTAARSAADRQSPPLVQAALADFLAEGHFARHVRRMRLLYERRQRALVEAAAETGGGLDVRPSPSGMHVVGWLNEGVDDRQASRAAARAGITAPPLSSYALEERPGPGLVLGYAGFPEDELRQAVHRLGDALS